MEGFQISEGRRNIDKRRKRSKKKRQGETQRVKPANICTSISERVTTRDTLSKGGKGVGQRREREMETKERERKARDREIEETGERAQLISQNVRERREERGESTAQCFQEHGCRQ